jgi:hypothetical protein
VDDIAALAARNEHFIQARRQGWWKQLPRIIGKRGAAPSPVCR